jgi:hypothetical protein
MAFEVSTIKSQRFDGEAEYAVEVKNKTTNTDTQSARSSAKKFFSAALCVLCVSELIRFSTFISAFNGRG